MSLTGCNSDDDNKLAENEFAVSFNHGVASGDPLSDAIILWTRVTPAGSPQGVNVTLQIADDENFESNRVQQTVVALASNDYTVKIDFTGLNAGSKYYYRFVTEDETSPVGQFKTLPEGDVSSVKFAVMSCANFPAGYFHAYAEAAKVAVPGVRTDAGPLDLLLSVFCLLFGGENVCGSRNSATIARFSHLFQ